MKAAAGDLCWTELSTSRDSDSTRVWNFVWKVFNLLMGNQGLGKERKNTGLKAWPCSLRHSRLRMAAVFLWP